MEMDLGNKEIEVNNNSNLSTVQGFYKGKNVFITGGTGFLGKILIEKLLRSTEVSTIYLLVREKKGKDVHTRIDDLLDDVVFERLKKEEPKFKHKIVGVGGDCALAGLGLTINDRYMLVKNVHVVFHVAATVRFDEKLHLAYAINVSGTKAILDLCRQIEHLKSVIHVSTAYANCHVEKIEEKFYDYPVNYEHIKGLLEKMSEETLEPLFPQILGKWPNTYAFTKALAEALIKDKSEGLPIGVFRPAIVGSTYKEPIPSWIDNFYGPTGICVGVASGLLKTLYCDDNVIANIVPADKCVAGLIASAWDVAQQTTRRIPENVKIYNYVSSTENAITWKEYIMLNQFYGINYPLMKCVGTISFQTTYNKNVNNFNKFMYHYVPAVIYDAVTLLTGQKPKMLKIYSKIHKFMSVIEYFCIRDWIFTNDNVQTLYNKMDDLDKKIFAMSMKEVNWLKYFRKYLLGVRQYLLKESDDTLEAAKSKLFKFEVLHNILKYSLGFFTASFIWNTFYSLTQKMLTPGDFSIKLT